MQRDMMQTYWPTLVGGMFFWVVWLVVMVSALLAFLRGMRALTEIARTLERIERRLSTKAGWDSSGTI